jgi:DNA-directed RNA polymerase specialized sigma24 family protein
MRRKPMTLQEKIDRAPIYQAYVERMAAWLMTEKKFFPAVLKNPETAAQHMLHNTEAWYLRCYRHEGLLAISGRILMNQETHKQLDKEIKKLDLNDYLATDSVPSRHAPTVADINREWYGREGVFPAELRQIKTARRAVDIYRQLEKESGYSIEVHDALIDYYEKNLSYKGIATLLGTSESSVKRWVDRLVAAGLVDRREK